eukprot:6209712-Pleurochrysis_carterae.AAC.1
MVLRYICAHFWQYIYQKLDCTKRIQPKCDVRCNASVTLSQKWQDRDEFALSSKTSIGQTQTA